MPEKNLLKEVRNNPWKALIKRWIIPLLIIPELEDEYNWDSDEIEDIEDLLVEKFREESQMLFWIHPLALTGLYVIMYLFASVPIDVLGLLFVLYGAFTMKAIVSGPYRIALGQRDEEERYEILKEEMAIEIAQISYGAIFFGLGLIIQIASKLPLS